MAIFNSMLSQIGRSSTWLSPEEYLKKIQPAKISERADTLVVKFKALQEKFMNEMDSSDALPFESTSPDSACIQGKEDFARIGGLVRWNNRSSNLCYFQEMGDKFEGFCRSADGKITPKTLSAETLLKAEDKVCESSRKSVPQDVFEDDGLPY